MASSVPRVPKLLLTQRGIAWTKQFDPVDHESVVRLVDGLTLVSHSEFDRSVDRLIRKCAEKLHGPLALFATREIPAGESLFACAASGGGELDAVGAGPDVGSEARVAQLIRQIARSDPQRFLNHPNVREMRKARCRAIAVVDDLIGTGERTRQFIDSIWRDPSVKSWRSLNYIEFFAIAYSATRKGARKVEAARSRPTVKVKLACPTFPLLPWRVRWRRTAEALCRNYGARTARADLALGYEDSMAALVFEHGCPDNVPAILWAPGRRDGDWLPLFPGRALLPPEKSVFPPEISRRDPVSVLLDVGQEHLANPAHLDRLGAQGTLVLLVLAMAAKGQRSLDALSFATSQSDEACARLLDSCIRWGFLTRRYRITQAGLAELRHARRQGGLRRELPAKGSEDYYPRQLRRPSAG